MNDFTILSKPPCETSQNTALKTGEKLSEETDSIYFQEKMQKNEGELTNTFH